MKLSSFVNLYRASSKPPVANGVFCGQLTFSAEIIRIIDTLRNDSNTAFEELLIDGKEVYEKDLLPKNGNLIEFTVRLPGDSSNRFHTTLEEFIKDASQLSKGEIPKDFYIISHDYHSLDSSRPKEIENLSSICQLIKKLSELAHYHDSKTSAPHLKLVFVQPDLSGSASTVVLDTKIEMNMLYFEPPDICLLDELACGMIQSDPHYNAKKDVFGVSLGDFLTKRSPQGDFAYLIQHWRDFNILYQNNLGTYLSGFAFHKAKREVAETEFHMAEQFSKVTSEIAGKLLGIPVSFAAVIAVVKSESLLERALLTLGLLLAAIVIAGAVRNQMKQLKRISHAKDIMFSSIEGKKDTYPEELKIAVSNMVSSLNQNEKDLSFMLWVFRILSWAPVAVAVILLYTNPLIGN